HTTLFRSRGAGPESGLGGARHRAGREEDEGSPPARPRPSGGGGLPRRSSRHPRPGDARTPAAPAGDHREVGGGGSQTRRRGLPFPPRRDHVAGRRAVGDLLRLGERGSGSVPTPRVGQATELRGTTEYDADGAGVVELPTLSPRSVRDPDVGAAA